MEKKIRCQWAEKRRFVINPDGQVWPCCYFANFAYLAKQYQKMGRHDELYDGHKAQMKHSVMVDREERGEDEFNAFEKPAHEILQGDWFTKTLPKSWEKEEDWHFQCMKMCQVDKDD